MEILKELKKQRYALESKEVLAIHKVWSEYFDGELPDNCFLDTGRESLEIIGPDRRSWGVCTIYYYSRWSLDEDTYKIEKLKASHSSGGGSEADEFEKMRIIGIIGTVLADHGDDIHAKLNEIVTDYSNLRKPIDRAIWDLEEAERKRDQKEAEKKRTVLLNKLQMEGLSWAPDMSLEFEEKWGGSLVWRKKDLPELQVRFNDSVRNIAWLRISKMSTSGKTCSVQLKRWRFDYKDLPGRVSYDPTAETTNIYTPDFVDDAVETFDRVQMSNIWDLLNIWRDKVTDNIDEDGNPYYLFPAEEEINAEIKKYDDYQEERKKPKEAKPLGNVKIS